MTVEACPVLRDDPCVISAIGYLVGASPIALVLVAGTATLWAAASLWIGTRGCKQVLSALSRVPQRIAVVQHEPVATPAPAAAPEAALPIASIGSEHDAASTSGAQVERSELPKQIGWSEPLSYSGAACSGVFVYVVSIAESAPRRSAVSMATKASGRGRYAHPGQRVDDWEVLAITDDWSGTNPTVWLARDAEVCRSGLTGNPARREVPRPPRRRRRRRR